MDISQFMCISLEIRTRYTYIQALQESVLILVKSILVFYADPFFVSFNSRFCSLDHTLAHVVDKCKWKEADEGRRPRNQKSTAKDKKREPKTKLKKKVVLKKKT
jgi:hypothetical protein